MSETEKSAPYTERVAQLLAPIPGASPAGADATFEPPFEALKAEIDKLASVTGEQPNWQLVTELASEILVSKAKDWRAGTWFAVATTKLRGLDGFAEGLALLSGLATTYWPTMFPEARRAKARANLVSWLTEQTMPVVDSREIADIDAAAVHACDELVNRLDGVLSEHLKDLHPGLHQLRNTIRGRVRGLAEQAKPAPPPPPPPSPPRAASTPPTQPTAPAPEPTPAPEPARAPIVVTTPSPSGVDEAPAAARQCGKSIMQIAQLVRRADPSNAWAYRMQRLGAWIAVQQLPPNEGGKTRLPVPPADVRKKLAAAIEAQRWMDALVVAEDATESALFWLDLHRIVAVAMDNLGALFLSAREGVGREVTNFVARFPNLVSLSFADGTPFADAATKAWLEGEAKKLGGASGSSDAKSVAGSEEDAELAQRFQLATDFVGSGKVAEGLGLAIQLAARGADARARFRARLRVAELAVQGSKPEIARPILEALRTEAEAHHLEVWEPNVCAELYALLLACWKDPKLAKNAGAELAAKQAEVFDRLCRLDPVAAIRAAG